MSAVAIAACRGFEVSLLERDEVNAVFDTLEECPGHADHFENFFVAEMAAETDFRLILPANGRFRAADGGNTVFLVAIGADRRNAQPLFESHPMRRLQIMRLDISVTFSAGGNYVGPVHRRSWIAGRLNPM